MGCPDDDVFELAARQHGAVSLPQMTDLGCTRAQRRRLLTAGALVPLAPRVFGLSTGDDSFERRTSAGLLALGPDAVASHLAAARLHGFVDDAEPEFTVPRTRRNATCQHAVHATDTLAAHARVVIDGLACTSLTRTVVDLATATDLACDRLAAIIERAGIDRDDLHDVLRRRGLALAGPAIDVERRFLAAIRRVALPRPDRVVGAARPTFHFAGYDVTVAIGSTASDWTSIARVTRQALLDAGWPTRPTDARAA